jgi:hypothetical protein
MVFGPAEAFTPEQLAELYDVNVLNLGTHSYLQILDGNETSRRLDSRLAHRLSPGDCSLRKKGGLAKRKEPN